MAKRNEIEYIEAVSKLDAVSSDAFETYLMKKPYSDKLCWQYLVDIGTVMRFLPEPPARLLDIGVGSGWTAEFYAKRGYAVVGIDISPRMIELCRRRLSAELDLKFEAYDYEEDIALHFGKFDAVVVYDALHHAEKEGEVIQNVFNCLKPKGLFITIEPGVGHGTAPESIQAQTKYGTTEKDMDFNHQKEIMEKSGFRSVSQYLRISHLPLEPVSDPAGLRKQREHIRSLEFETSNGYTSLVIAQKIPTESVPKMELLWQGGPYYLRKYDDRGSAEVSEIRNGNGLEKRNNKSFFWIGKGDTEVDVLSTRKGIAIIQGAFFLGPSLPDKPSRELLILTDNGYQSKITISANGFQALRVPVIAGENRITLRPLDKPSVLVTGPNDPRSLLIGVEELHVTWTAGTRPEEVPQ